MRNIPRLIRSFILSLGGEGIQSGFHFVLNLILIRLFSAYDYGIFAIAFVLGGISLNYVNALVSVPAAVHMPRLKSPGAMNFQDVVFGSVAAVFAGLIGVVVSFGLFVTLGHGIEAVAGGAFVGLWMLRFHIRIAMFARRATGAVTLSDISYTTSGVALVASASPACLRRSPSRMSSPSASRCARCGCASASACGPRCGGVIAASGRTFHGRCSARPHGVSRVRE